MDEKRHSRHQRWREANIVVRTLMVLGGLSLVCGIVVLGVFIVVWLWNWLMPVIFRLPMIGFWQAFGLLVLTTILFNRPHLLRRGSRERWRKRVLRDRLREAAKGRSDSVSDRSPGDE